MIRRSLVLLAAAAVLAACGSEPTATYAPVEARRNANQLTVGVSGPTQLQGGECAAWFSSVSGGVGPYVYSWSGVNTTDSTGDWVAGWLDSPGYPAFNYVTVDVTDANGKTGSGSIVVYMAQSYPGPGC